VWFVVWVARRAGRASNAPTQMYTATDGAACADADTAAAPSDAPTAAFVADATAQAPLGSPSGMPGDRPPAPAGTATAEEFAAWRAQQAQWKAQNDAFRARQSSEQRAASLAAQEQYRREREARRAVERAHHARTRSNPLYSFVAIGLALIVGGVVTVVQGDGVVEPAGVLAGLGATLVVLAIAIIVNGARGKRPGGAQGVAALVLVPLLVAAVLPHDPHISYIGNARFTPSDESSWNRDGYFVGIGDATVDLRDYYDTAAPEGADFDESDDVFLAVGSGETTVYLPADAYIDVNVTTVLGSVATPGLAEGGATSTGRFGDGQMRYAPAADPEWENATRVLYVSLLVGSGDVTILREPASAPNTTTGDSE
jgi:hypothetical protein